MDTQNYTFLAPSPITLPSTRSLPDKLHSPEGLRTIMTKIDDYYLTLKEALLLTQENYDDLPYTGVTLKQRIITRLEEKMPILENNHKKIKDLAFDYQRILYRYWIHVRSLVEEVKNPLEPELEKIETLLAAGSRRSVGNVPASPKSPRLEASQNLKQAHDALKTKIFDTLTTLGNLAGLSKELDLLNEKFKPITDDYARISHQDALRCFKEKFCKQGLSATFNIEGNESDPWKGVLEKLKEKMDAYRLNLSEKLKHVDFDAQTAYETPVEISEIQQELPLHIQSDVDKFRSVSVELAGLQAIVEAENAFEYHFQEAERAEYQELRKRQIENLRNSIKNVNKQKSFTQIKHIRDEIDRTRLEIIRIHKYIEDNYPTIVQFMAQNNSPSNGGQ